VQPYLLFNLQVKFAPDMGLAEAVAAPPYPKRPKTAVFKHQIAHQPFDLLRE
jgi:hypothetical protein